MRKILLFLFSLLIGIGLFIWIGKMVGWQEIKKAFFVFTGWQGLVIFGLTLLMLIIGNWKWREILKGESVKISFRELFKPYLAGFTLMFLFPIIFLGGEFLRGYVVKERHLVPWPKIMASIVIDRILELTTHLAVIFFGLLFFLYKIGLPSKNLGIIFGSIFIFIFFAAGISYIYLKIFKKESIIKFIAKKLGNKKIKEKNTFLEAEKEILIFFNLKKKAVWKGISLSFLKAAVMFLRAWLLVIFLGGKIGALSAVSILSFSYLALMIPIPTSLGSHEVIQTFSFNALGLGANMAPAFTMIIRGAELMIALIGIIILFRLGFELLKNTLFKKIEKFSINNEI